MKDLIEALTVAANFADRARKTYADTKEWTANATGSCETIRVPVALLNRIRDAQAEVAAARDVYDHMVTTLKQARACIAGETIGAPARRASRRAVTTNIDTALAAAHAA